MGNKRIRSSAHIKGLGTGNVPEEPPAHQRSHNNNKPNKPGNAATDDDLYKYDRKRKNYIRNERKNEKNKKKKDQESMLPKPLQAFDFYMMRGASGSGQENLGSPRPLTSIERFTWQVSAFALLGAVIFLSALFLHLIADAAEKANNSHKNRARSNKRRSPPVVSKPLRKKKTDEWNDDVTSSSAHQEEHQHLKQRESVRRTVKDTRPPSLYYPYEPRLQQYRHRKNTGTSSTGAGGATSTTAAVQPPQGGLQHRAGATYTMAPQQAPPSPPAGATAAAAATTTTTLTPTSARATIRSVPSSAAKAAAAAAGSETEAPPYAPVLPGTYRSPEPAAAAAAAAAGQQMDNMEVLRPPAVAIPAHEQQSVLNAQRMTSDASSFGSTSGALPLLHQDSESSAAAVPKRSPTVSLSVPGRDGKPTVLLTPGKTDEVTTPSAARKKYVDIPDFAIPEETPRAANTRRFRRSFRDSSDDSLLGKMSGGSKGAGDRSATSSRQESNVSQGASSSASNQDKREMPTVPFMPSLMVPNLERPPRSINIDELHLYQMMETGNVHHWEARVAEESRMLHSKAFPGSKEPDAADVIMRELSERSGAISQSPIASDDPRKSIKHKREDLTVSTDASASLQGAVDFKELELVEVIGGGGFGQVWKAVWRGTPVAVKVLTGSAQSKNVPRPVLEEFAAEINLLKGMRHPNICLYMGASLDPPNRAIITELAANGSLWDALRLPLMPPFTACDGHSRDAWPLALYQPDSRHGAPPTSASRMTPSIPPRNTWPWLLVRRVALGAARGMSYLHSGTPPILHRDLKSANILLDESYTAKVCDFGLSRLKAHERSMTGNCGTVQWMAPEVLANVTYNEKADIFSYGIILWELLTGQCPYDGMSAIQCALAVLNQNKRPIIPSWCPPSLHALIRSCVKKDPEERPSFPDIIKTLDAMPS